MIYEPPFAKKKAAADPSVKPKGELAIGFGASGSNPRTFFPPKGRNADVSYLKIFLTTEYRDLSYIAQKSPLTEDDDDGRTSDEWKPLKRDLWDTILVPIVTVRKTHSVEMTS
jgi:hypothetical protein